MLGLGLSWPLSLLLACDRGWWWLAPTWLGSLLLLSLSNAQAGVIVTWGGWHRCRVIDGDGGWHLLGWGCCHCRWAGVVDGHVIG